MSGTRSVVVRPVLAVWLLASVLSTEGVETACAQSLDRTIGGVACKIQPLAIHLGPITSRPEPGRILVVDLEITNTDAQPLAVDLTAVTAQLDTHAVSTVTDFVNIRDLKFSYFGNQYRFRYQRENPPGRWTLRTPKDIVPGRRKEEPRFTTLTATLAPGEAGRFIVPFYGFPEGRDQATLTLQWDGLSTPLDLAEWSSARSKIDVTRVGPRESIGVIHVRGAVDRLGVNAIADALEVLQVQNVTHIIIRIAESATFSEVRLPTWLYNSWSAPERTRLGWRYAFPDLPTLITSMQTRLLTIESQDIRDRQQFANQNGVQPTGSFDEALMTAARPIMKRLSRDEILRVLRSDQPSGVLAAALREGRDLFRSPDESLVVEFASSDAPVVRRAAIAALAVFDSPAVVERLEQSLGSTVPEERLEAVRATLSARTARFDRLRRRLAAAVADDPVGLAELAREPLESWRSVFRDAADSDDDELRCVGWQGLYALGGSAAQASLVEAIISTSTRGRSEAVTRITSHASATGTNIDSAYVNAAMRVVHERRTDDATVDLLTVARHRPAVPQLLDQLVDLDHGTAFRVLRLASIGMTSADETQLAERIVELKHSVADEAFKLLIELKSPARLDALDRLIELREPRQFQTVLRLIRQDDSLAMAERVADHLLTIDKQPLWDPLADYLSDVGGPIATDTLAQILVQGPNEKRAIAARKLTLIRERSPARSLAERGLLAQNETRYDDAFIWFDRAIEADPNYVATYNHRGLLSLQPAVNRPNEAIADYQTALEIAPHEPSLHVGMALCYAQLGRANEAVQTVDSMAAWMRNYSGLNEYNTACVYGLLAATDDTLSTAEQRAAWKQLGLETLEKAHELGFFGSAANIDHAVQDIDLTSLHGAEFDDLIRRARQTDEG